MVSRVLPGEGGRILVVLVCTNYKERSNASGVLRYA